MELLSLFTFRRPRPDVNLAIHVQGTGGTRPPLLSSKWSMICALGVSLWAGYSGPILAPLS